MKRANGTGSVYKLSGNRRRKWRAVVTRDYAVVDGKLKRNEYTIGYFVTRPEAEKAVAEYLQNPILKSNYTLSEIYEQWSKRHYPTIAFNTAKNYRTSWKIAEPLYNTCISDIKLSHLQKVVDTSGKAKPRIRNFKILLTMVFDYAIKHDLIDKNPAENIDIKNVNDSEKPRPRIPFSPDEITQLWREHDTVKLCLIFSGIRLKEFCTLRKENIDFENEIITIDRDNTKTDAGERKIPIHKELIPLWRELVEQATTEHLIDWNGCKLLSSMERIFYRDYWSGEHRPHDCRHTCESLLQRVPGISQVTIDKIIGHAGNGIGQTVYTHAEILDLHKWMNMVETFKPTD